MAMSMTQWFDDVRRREAAIRALRAASRTLLAGAGVAGLMALLFILFSTRALPPGGTSALVISPLVFAILAGLLARRRPVDLARVLLRMDFAMGLEARLSAIYELETRAPESFLRRRLELRVAHRLPEWRRGLPLPRWTIPVAASGLLILGGIVAVDRLGLDAKSEDASHPVRVLSESEATGSSEEDEASDASAGSAVPPNGSGDVEDASGLGRILSELGVDPRGLRSPGDETVALDEGIDEGTWAALQAWHGVLEARLGQGEALFGAEDRVELARLAADVPPIVEEALLDVLAASTPIEVESALDRFGEAIRIATSATPATSDSSTEVTEPRRLDEGGEGDAAAVALPEAGGETSPSVPETGDASAASREDEREAPAGSVIAQGEEDLSAAASTEFVRESAPATLTGEGEVGTYLTLGVPIETEVSGPEGSVAQVDYERIDELLETRDVPREAIDLVRTYFEAITGGGT